jgi:hypothetical protein
MLHLTGHFLMVLDGERAQLGELDGHI